MSFEPILYGPLFVQDAQDVNLVASSTDPVNITVSVGGSSWTIPVTPVLTGGRYLAPLRMREILASVVDIPGLGAAGVREVPVVTLSAGGTTMSFRAVYGSAAGHTPTQLAGHWLTWRDQISTTQTWARERLTFLAGQDLLGWQSGTYVVQAKVFFASGDPETVTLASGTIQSGCRYVTVDASFSAISAAVQGAGTITAWDISYNFSGQNASGAVSVNGYPLRLILARQDVRVKEFIFSNSFGVEDRVISSGRSNPKVEGSSVPFLNGGTERELRNDAEEGKEVYSGHISSARGSALWSDFLKSKDRHILLSGSLERIIVDSQETDMQDNALGSVKFTYHLAKLDAGRYFDDASGLGNYDPGEQYGALYVGSEPPGEEIPSEDLFFLKTRLDEFPAADLTDELLFLVQNPLTLSWGNLSLNGLKDWLQEEISAYETPVWSGPWEDYSAGVADYALAASLGRDLYDRILQIEQNPYNLPIASDTVLGGIKVGANLSIDAAGVLSAVDTIYGAGTGLDLADGVFSLTQAVRDLLAKADSAIQFSDLKSLTLKVGPATIGSYTPAAAKTLTVTAQHLYDAIGDTKYHKYGGDDVLPTFKIGGATLTWHAATKNTAAYLELDAAIVTAGDQIVISGTPGGGGEGGASYLYDLLDFSGEISGKPSAQKIIAFDPTIRDKQGGLGAWKYVDMPVGSVTSVAGVDPVSGDIPTADLKSALSLGSLAYLDTVPIATSSIVGGVKSSTTGTTASRDYLVEVNSDGTMKVNVPWTDTKSTAYNIYGVNESFYVNATCGSMSRYKIVGFDADGRLVPLTAENTTAATKTQTAVGFVAKKGLGYYPTNEAVPDSSTLVSYIYYAFYHSTGKYNFNADVPYDNEIYLKGTYNPATDIFTLDQTSKTSWYVFVPTSAAHNTTYFTAGSYYMYVGRSRKDTNNYFQVEYTNPLYYYDATLGLIPAGNYVDNAQNARLDTLEGNFTNGSANSAINDSAGNNIASTYLPLSAGSSKALTGDLYITNAKKLVWFDKPSSGNGSSRDMLRLNENNQLIIGTDLKNCPSNGQLYLNGTGLYFRTANRGSSNSWAIRATIDSSGYITFGSASALATSTYPFYVNSNAYMNGNLTLPSGKKLTIGDAEIEWIPNDGNGYLKINKPLLTEGDQIVDSGTPGGGGTGGAGFLYELGDVYHDSNKTKVLRADGTEKQVGDVLQYLDSTKGWVAVAASSIGGVTSVVDQTGDVSAQQISTALNLGAAATYGVASSVSQNDTTHLVTGAAVWSAIDALPEPMVFKGSLGTGGTITSLPAASSANDGWTYKVITDGTYAGQAAKIGDLFISNGSSWIWIPSGDEPEGTVTSIGLTLPTGLVLDTVNGSASPITTSGTFKIAFDTGYSIPTTTKQGNWDTAYGWGDHAQAGYLLASVAATTYHPKGGDTQSNTFKIGGATFTFHPAVQGTSEAYMELDCALLTQGDQVVNGGTPGGGGGGGAGYLYELGDTFHEYSSQTYSAILRDSSIWAVAETPETAVNGDLLIKTGNGWAAYPKSMVGVTSVATQSADGLMSSADKLKSDQNPGIIDLEDNGTTSPGTWLAKPKQGTISAYTDGLTVRYKVTVAGANPTTLNISGLGAKNVYRVGTTKLTTHYPVGAYIVLYYASGVGSGSWQVLNDYDADSPTTRQYISTDNVDYPILTRYRTTAITSGSYDTTYTRFIEAVTINPSTGNLSATRFTEGGTALSAKYLGISAAAASAAKLNTDAGSATNPVYFSNGVPAACTYSLNKTVPSDAVFTDENVKVTIQNLTTSSWYYPVWSASSGIQEVGINNGLRYCCLEGTASNNGYAIFVLGNSVASGSAGNKYGIFRIYAKSAYKGDIFTANLTAHQSYTLPDATGTVVLDSATQALTNKTYNGLTLTKETTGFTIAGGTTSKTLTVSNTYTLGDACAKAVVTSIDTSASLPTSNAVKTFVEGKGYLTSVAFSDLTSHPTTIANYGITDAYISSSAVYLGSNSVGTSTDPIGHATQAKRLKYITPTQSAGAIDLNTVLEGGGVTRNVWSKSYWNHVPTDMTLFGTALQFNAQSAEVGAIQILGGGSYTGTTPTGSMWWRIRNSDGWADDWHLLYDDSNLTASVIVSTLGTTAVNRATADANGDTISSTYLKLAGGTMTGGLIITKTGNDHLTVNRTNSGVAWVRFQSDGTTVGYLGVGSNNEAYFHNTSAQYNLWHSGNSGTGYSWGCTTLTASSNVSVGGTLGVTGLTTATGGILLPNNVAISAKNSSNTTTEVLCYSSSDTLRIGYGHAAAGTTDIYGKRINLRSSDSTAGPDIYIGCGTNNKPAGNIIFQESLSSERNGLKIAAEHGASASRVNLNIYTSNNGSTSPYAPNWVSTLFVKYDGNVGIGTTSLVSGARLTVDGAIATSGDQVISSDATLKTNLRPITLTAKQIAEAPAVSFDWKDGHGHSFGSIAQYWKPLVPEAVHGEEGNHTLSYAQLGTVLGINNGKEIYKLQIHETEQDKEIRTLKARVEELENEVKRLRS